jgi:hypothetical protein
LKPVVHQYAKAAPKGMETTTPISCHTQRASHVFSRAGHCSNRPKTSMASSPTVSVRATQT